MLYIAIRPSFPQQKDDTARSRIGDVDSRGTHRSDAHSIPQRVNKRESARLEAHGDGDEEGGASGDSTGGYVYNRRTSFFPLTSAPKNAERARTTGLEARCAQERGDDGRKGVTAKRRRVWRAVRAGTGAWRYMHCG
jgi:hypothetical protein